MSARWCAPACVALALALALSPPAGAAEPGCATPQLAADSLFGEPDAACLDTPPGAAKEELATRLRQVLDARGLYVPVPALPNTPDYRDASGAHRLQPLPEEAAWLVLERSPDGDWRYARSTLREVPARHQATFSRVSRWFQSQLPPLFYERALGAQLWQWLYALLLTASAWGLGRIAWTLLHLRANSLVRRLRVPLDEAKFKATAGPLVWTAIGAVFLWSIPDLQLGVAASDLLYRVVRIALAASLVLGASRFVDVAAGIAAAKAATSESKLDDQLVPLAHQAGRVVVWVVGLLFVASQIGVDVWKLMAGVSLGSLAFALAAQDSAANLFGAANIFIDKPFQIGDAVVIGGVEGVVEEVGFRSVKVRTFENSLVTIPNSTITNSNVNNLGRRERRRVRMTLGLTYDTAPDALDRYVARAREILAGQALVDPDFEVHFHTFGASSLDLLVQYHIRAGSWREELQTRAAVNEAFLRAAAELKVSFAFPSTSVYLESAPPSLLGARG